MFRNSDTRKVRNMSVSGVERFVLGGGVKVDLDWGDDANSKSGVKGDVNRRPGAAYSIRVKERIGVLECLT